MPTRNETKDKINHFKNVAIGWHFGEGVPADDGTINAALQLNDSLHSAGFPSTDAFLGIGGQIQVNGYRSELYWEFIIEDGSISYILENDEQAMLEEENLSLLDAVSRIQFWGRKWVMSEYSTKITSITHEEDFLAQLFLVPEQEASQSLMRTVFVLAKEPSVSISRYITQELRVIPRFTSNSPRIFYRQLASI